MHAILLDTHPETTAWLEAACGQAGVACASVGSFEGLERVARRAHYDDLVVVECVSGAPADIDRCRRVAARTGLDLAIVYVQPAALRELEQAASGPVLGLDRDMPFRVLVRLLRERKGKAVAERGRQRRRVFSPRQRQIARCLVRGQSLAEAAEELGVHVGTVKRQVSRMLEKLGLDSTGELTIALRFLPDE